MSRRSRPRRLPFWGVLAAASLIPLLPGCQKNSADRYLSAGDAARQATKFSEAEENYKEAAKIAPNDVRTHVALGDLYVFEHKSAPAQLEFMKVLDLDPKNAAAHAALGSIYADQTQYGLAESQYRAAVVLDPARPSYYTDLGSVLVKQSKGQEAEAQFRTAIGLDPKNAQAHFALANLLSSEPGRGAEAAAEYQQARALEPKLVSPTPEAAATAEAPAATTHTVKPLNKIFLLTHSSPVYESPDAGSRVVAHVVRRKYVHVTGIAGSWLQVKLRNGTVGFVPTSAAE